MVTLDAAALDVGERLYVLCLLLTTMMTMMTMMVEVVNGLSKIFQLQLQVQPN
jgi:hypothetical protein